MKTKRFLALVLSVAMIILTLPTVTLAETTAEVMYSTDNGESWTYDSLMNAIFSYGADVEIKLLKDITLTSSGWSYAPVFANTNANVTIDGQGYTITRGNGVGSFATMAQDGSTLTLKNITIDGGAVWSGDDPATRTNSGYSVANAYLFDVYGGTLILDNGTVICNSHLTGSNSYGGAIAVSQPGKVVMNDGAEIKNCAAVSGGAICVVAGNEAFTMNGGKISNCYASSGGGAIFTQGNAVMNGGELLGNASGNNGGAVTIQSSGVFTLKDGTIKNNASVAGGGAITILGASATLNVEGGEISANTITGSLGGGVLVNAGTFNVSGSPIIKDNKSGTANSNVYLGASKVINLNGALTNTEKIGITMKSIGTFTSGWNTYMGTAENSHFISDNKAYIVSEEATELKLENAPEPIYTISFNANGGSGIMSNVDMTAGDYALPECSFTAPNGYEFKAWSVGDVEKSVGETIAITEDTTVTAVWKALEATAPSISAVSADLTNDNSLTYGEITAEDKLTVTAEADSNTEYNALEYQWYKVASASSKDNAIAISGATNETYAIPTDTAAGDCYYYCAVTATRKDNGEKAIADTRIVSVTVNKLPVNITWNMPPSLVFDGSEKTIAAELANKVGNDSVNLTIEGTTTATNKGEYTATVTAIDNENYTLINGENLTKTWSIAETTNTFTTNLAIMGWVFGETPNAPTATTAFGTPKYTYSSSIDGAYSADVPTEAGTYYVKATVTGTENYAEISETKEFVISEKELNADSITAIADVTYTGEEIKPIIEVKDGETALVLETDYEISYQDNTNAGTAKVVITFKGNYKGTVEKEFTILSKVINTAISLTAPVANAVPQTTIETDEYTATVVWSPDVTDKFAYSTVYTATITITPKANYTVTGISENSYTVDGAETVTNTADSATVTVTYAGTGRRPSSGGGSSTTTTTTKNEDGSTTKTTTNRNTGTTTEVTTNTDGSTTTVETKKDGTVTTTEKDKDGNTTTTVENPNGRSITTEKNKDGSEKVTEKEADGTTTTTEKDSEGNKTVTTEKPDGSTTTEETKKDGTKVTTETTADGETTAEIEAMSETEVFIPVANAEDVTMLTITDEDGNVTEITDIKVVGGGVAVSVSGNASVAVSKEAKKTFVDVHPVNHWATADIDYAFINGLMTGVSETHFAPDSTLTRAMLVTVLYRNEGEPATNRSIPFADIDMGAYYANAVIWAQQNGIVKGISETEFAPNDNITREQIAAIMHRYAQYKGYDVSVGENTNILSYTDFDSISEYAIASMQYAVGSGLMKGKSTSTLNPLDTATRAEIAAILHRFIEANK